MLQSSDVLRPFFGSGWGRHPPGGCHVCRDWFAILREFQQRHEQDHWVRLGKRGSLLQWRLSLWQPVSRWDVKTNGASRLVPVAFYPPTASQPQEL